MFNIGIDPGASGGIAMIDGDGHVVSCSSMPATDRDILDLLKSLKVTVGGPVRAVIELVHSMPGQGVSSTMKFGMSVGRLHMALIAAEIPFDQVTPQTWQKALRCQVGKTRDKNITKRRAQALFPHETVTHAVADALLLAEYCRRFNLGLLT